MSKSVIVSVTLETFLLWCSVTFNTDIRVELFGLPLKSVAKPSLYSPFFLLLLFKAVQRFHVLCMYISGFGGI